MLKIDFFKVYLKQKKRKMWITLPLTYIPQPERMAEYEAFAVVLEQAMIEARAVRAAAAAALFELRAAVIERLTILVEILSSIGRPNNLTPMELSRYQKHGPKVFRHTCETGLWPFAVALVHPTENYYIMVYSNSTGSEENAPYFMEEWSRAYHQIGWGVEYITLEKAAPVIEAATKFQVCPRWVSVVLLLLAFMIHTW